MDESLSEVEQTQNWKQDPAHMATEGKQHFPHTTIHVKKNRYFLHLDNYYTQMVSAKHQTDFKFAEGTKEIS